MTTKHRKNIVREAKRNIANEIKDYSSKSIGEQERIFDVYIEKACIARGYTLSNFYFEEGKKLDIILGRN